MSDDLVNQLTLNFLISKQQLQKLNKKNKDDAKTKWNSEYLAQRERIKILFEQLLFNNEPDDLLIDVRDAFDEFVNKSVYYFKAHDTTENLEKERSQEIHEDIDFEKEERDIVNGNYKEHSNDEESEEEEEGYGEEEDEGYGEEPKQVDDEEDEEEEEKSTTNIPITHHPIIVKSKYKKQSTSEGVDDLQKLPLDWFQNVRQNYKKNQIIPRKKEPTITEPTFRDVKKKI